MEAYFTENRALLFFWGARNEEEVLKVVVDLGG